MMFSSPNLKLLHVRNGARSAAAEDEGDFVDRDDGEVHAACIVGEGSDGGIGEIWLRTKDALRLQSSQLVARHAWAQREKPADTSGLVVECRSAMLARETPLKIRIP